MAHIPFPLSNGTMSLVQEGITLLRFSDPGHYACSFLGKQAAGYELHSEPLLFNTETGFWRSH